jgi:biofilm PGA synthesis N-glycosyltransferase PgaC
MKEEQKRKVRISAGAFQAMLLVKPLFNVIKYPKLSFQFISHRVLRWAVRPICLVLIFISNFLLEILSEKAIFTYLLSTQVLFYFFAIMGWILAINSVKNKFLYIPYYFLFMNVSVLIGLYRIMTKKQNVLWEKAGRQMLN